MTSSSTLSAVSTRTSGPKTKVTWKTMLHPRWHQPELSTGAQCAALDLLGRRKCWCIKNGSPADAVWRIVSKAITGLLEENIEHLEAKNSDLNFGMFMVGRKPEKSIPTILFSCESAPCRRRSLDLVHKKAVLIDYPGVMMAESSVVPRPLAIEEVLNLPFLSPGVYLNGQFQGYGTSVLISTANDQRPRKATIGGFVWAGNDKFALTAAHPFSEPRHEIEEDESDVEFAFYGSVDPYDDSSDDERDAYITSRASISSGSTQSSGINDNGSGLSSQSTSNSESNWKLQRSPDTDELTQAEIARDNPSIPHTRGQRGVKRQKQVSLVSEEDARGGGNSIDTPLDQDLVFQDHLRMQAELQANEDAQVNPRPLKSKDNTTLPRQPDDDLTKPTPLYVGSCAAVPKGKKHDWALLNVGEISDECHICWRGREISPKQIAPITADREVLIITAGKTTTGKLSAAPSFTKAPGEDSFRKLWTVTRLEGTFEDGDCGSWVIDPDSEALYGHLVSGYPGTTTGSIISSVDIFEEINMTVGSCDLRQNSLLRFAISPALKGNGDFLMWGDISYNTDRPPSMTFSNSASAGSSSSMFRTPSAADMEVFIPFAPAIPMSRFLSADDMEGFTPSTATFLSLSAMPRLHQEQSAPLPVINHMTGLDSLSKPSYVRPKHERVYCPQCEGHPDGFWGEHELRRHQERDHQVSVKKWICIEPPGSGHPIPALLLRKCKNCLQKKKYGAYYNAAAHLRRTHFKPKNVRRISSKVDDPERGGNGSRDWPPMSELKHWMKEVEEEQQDYTSSLQIEEDEVVDAEMSDCDSPRLNNFPNFSPVGNEMLNLSPFTSLNGVEEVTPVKCEGDSLIFGERVDESFIQREFPRGISKDPWI